MGTAPQCSEKGWCLLDCESDQKVLSLTVLLDTAQLKPMPLGVLVNLNDARGVRISIDF